MLTINKSMRPKCFLDNCDKVECQVRYTKSDKLHVLLWLMHDEDELLYNGKTYSMLPPATVNSYSSKRECAEANIEIYVSMFG